MAPYDLGIIGSGPGGYVAAIRAAQLGLKTVCIEREAIGGVCLNWGCVPSKALIRNAEVLNLVNDAESYGITTGKVKADYSVAHQRSRRIVTRLTKGIASLFKKNEVDFVEGEARLVDAHTIAVGDTRIEAKNVIVATGARPKPLPGVDIDGTTVITYREAVLSDSVPKDVVIIGGGPIGLEFAYVYNAYGADVTVIEFESHILPREDAEVAAALHKALTKQGINILTSTACGWSEVRGKRVRVHMDGPDGHLDMETERMLVAVGISPNTEDLGLENAGVETDRGFIKVDSELRANVEEGVYAIGDVTGAMPLAHVAQNQGVHVVERIAGGEPYPIDPLAIPRAVYCNPQVASMGLTEEEATAQGLSYKVGKFPFLANAKALALNDYEGFAKVLVDSSSGEMLGAHLIGHDVTELLGELSLTRIMEGTNLEVGAVVNAHPTLSEVVKEAALAADGRAVHI
ncbi:MAG: dihydrolipoyl dehydrogenase [Dehalococcoidia bacterium]